MNRRAFLSAVAGGAAGVAGCNARSPDPTTLTAYGTVHCGFERGRTTEPAEQSQLSSLDGSWPTTYHDNRLTSYNPDATPPRDCPRTQWRSQIEVQDTYEGTREVKFRLNGSPAVVDGHCYVADIENEFYAFDAATGRERWRREFRNTENRGVTVFRGVAYFSSSAWVRAIDVRTRDPLWKTDFDRADFEGRDPGAYSATSAPTVTPNAVTVGTVGGMVETYERRTGRRRWRYDTVADPPEDVRWADDEERYPPYPIVPAPAVADGTVYAGDIGGAVTALDVASGDRRWRVQLDTPVDGVAVAADSVFVTTQTDLYRLAREDGQVLWQLGETFDVPVRTTATPTARQPGIHVLGSPAVAVDNARKRSVTPSGSVYVAAARKGSDRQIRAVDAATGSVEWTAPVWLDPSADLSVGGDVVFTGIAGHVVAVDRDDGSILWGVEGYPETDTCALAGDAVFVSDAWGHLYAVA